MFCLRRAKKPPVEGGFGSGKAEKGADAVHGKA